MSPSLDRVGNLECRIVGGPPTKKPLPVIPRGRLLPQENRISGLADGAARRR
jgi:hypothetical protein